MPKPYNIRKILKDIYLELCKERIYTGAAALAFYLTLAIFPALIFLLSILPYLPIEKFDFTLKNIILNNLPYQASQAIAAVLSDVMANKRPDLLSTGFLLALWAASSGFVAIIEQVNLTYNTLRPRSFLQARATGLLLTFIYFAIAILSIILTIAGGWWDSYIGETYMLRLFLQGLRWVSIIALILFSFAIVYYLGPNKKMKFVYISPGSVFGTSVLIAASTIFDYFITNVGNYTATYGSLSGIIVFMLWLYLMGFVLLTGAEINEIVARNV